MVDNSAKVFSSGMKAFSRDKPQSISQWLVILYLYQSEELLFSNIISSFEI